MGEDQRRHVAEHHERHLEVPGAVLAQERVVDRVRGGAEEVPALAERVRGEVLDRLALEDAGTSSSGRPRRPPRSAPANVEGSRELLLRLAAADRRRAVDAGHVEAADQHHAGEDPERSMPTWARSGCSCRALVTSVSWTARSFHSRPWREAVERDRPDHRRAQPDRPGAGSSAAARPAAAGRRRTRSRRSRRHPREQVVVDGEPSPGASTSRRPTRPGRERQHGVAGAAVTSAPGARPSPTRARSR